MSYPSKTVSKIKICFDGFRYLGLLWRGKNLSRLTLKMALEFCGCCGEKKVIELNEYGISIQDSCWYLLVGQNALKMTKSLIFISIGCQKEKKEEGWVL